MENGKNRYERKVFLIPKLGLGAGGSSMAREHTQNTFVEGSYSVSLQTRQYPVQHDQL